MNRPSQPANDSTWRSGLLGFFERNYGLDLRSLALFRIALALIILGDLLLRARSLEAMYSDFGILPRAVLIDRFADQWIASFHLMSGRWEVQAALFLMAAFFAVQLLLGYRTRWATFFCWLFLTSLQNRNPAILQGGDTLIRLLMFWAMFLPLGARFSVDEALEQPPAVKPTAIFHAGTFALMAQVAMVYWFAVSLKTGPEWRSEGTAVYYALSLEQLATPLGRYLLDFPALLQFLTFFTITVEALAPVFLFFPFLSGPVRTMAVLILVGLQLGFATCLYVGHFPFIACAMMLPLLPTWFWERGNQLAGHLRREEERGKLRLYFDGGCDFCRKTALIFRALTLPAYVPIAPAQDEPAIHAQMVEEKSWVVIDPRGQAHYRTEAVATALSYSPAFRWLAPILRAAPVQRLGDTIYRAVERNRPWLSQAVSGIRFRPNPLRLGGLGNLLAVFFLLYVIAWNISILTRPFWIPIQYRWVGVFSRVDQIWDMFTPSPLREDGWYIVHARRMSGEELDLFRPGQPVSFEKPSPAQVAAQYTDERWRKYYLNLYGDNYAPYRIHYARYLCRKWNRDLTRDDPSAIDKFEIYFTIRVNVPRGIEPPPLRRVLLHRHFCWQ